MTLESIESVGVIVFVVKLLAIVLVFIYFLIALLILRQVFLMNKAIKTPLAPILNLFAVIQIFVVIFIFIITIFA